MRRREEESEHPTEEAEAKLEDMAPRLELTRGAGMTWRGGVALSTWLTEKKKTGERRLFCREDE